MDIIAIKADVLQLEHAGQLSQQQHLDEQAFELGQEGLRKVAKVS